MKFSRRIGALCATLLSIWTGTTFAHYVQSDPIGLAGGSLSTYQYVNSSPLSHVDQLGLATQSDIGIALQVIHSYAPELFPAMPTSVTSVWDLHTTLPDGFFGQDLQGYTDYSNNIQIRANLYGRCGQPVDPTMYWNFLQTLAHEWQHVQATSVEKAVTHGVPHDQIDHNADLIADAVLKNFERQRKSTPQDAGKCGCP